MKQIAKFAALAALILIVTGFAVRSRAQTPPTAVLAPSTPIGAQAPVQAQDVQLTAVSDVLADQSTGATAHYDFGTVSRFTTPTIQHDFVLQNGGAQPVVITRLQPSCSCTTATILGSTPDDGKATVAPGKQVTVHVSIDTARVGAGPVMKDVFVLAQGQDSPVAVLLVTGTAKPVATFTPSVVDLGELPTGSARTRTGELSATPDRIVFGKVNPEIGRVLRFQILANTPEAASSLKASSAYKFITARFVPQRAGEVANDVDRTRILELTLSPGCPVTSLETQVFVTSDDGQQLLLPVSADIVAE